MFEKSILSLKVVKFFRLTLSSADSIEDLTGKLIDIDPFDQPAVEQVKTITKKLLS